MNVWLVYLVENCQGPEWWNLERIFLRKEQAEEYTRTTKLPPLEDGWCDDHYRWELVEKHLDGMPYPDDEVVCPICGI